MAGTDDDRRTVRGVPDASWDAAVKAARRAGIPTGKWICNAIDLALQAERQPIDMLTPSDAVSAAAIDGLGPLSGALAALAQAASAGLPVSRAAARDVVRVLRSQVRDAGGLAPLGRPRDAGSRGVAIVGPPAGPALLNGIEVGLPK